MRREKVASAAMVLASDVENFKRKMLPKKYKEREPKSKRIKLISVNQVDTEDFKQKFHPDRKRKKTCVKYPPKIVKSNTDEMCETEQLSKTDDKSEKLEKQFLCDVCAAMFKSIAKMKEHSKIHSEVKEYKCPHCNYESYRERNLKTHILTHEEKKPIQCPKCEYTCIHNYQLKAHLLLHETDTPFQCNMCQATYKKKASLKLHMLTHSNVHKFKCEDCKYVGNRYADFRRHVLIHSKAKPIKCPYCNYCCIRQSQLFSHTLVHRSKNTVGDRDAILSSLSQNILYCDLCDYVCTVPFRLKKHKTSHTLASSFICDLCNFSCADSSSLRKHKRQHASEGQAMTSRSNQADKTGTLPLASHQAEKNAILSSTEDRIFVTSSDNLLTDAQVEIFSQADNNPQIFHSEHQTIILTTAVGESETFTPHSDETIIVCSDISQENEEVPERKEHFTVQDLTGFTFDKLTLQPTHNCLLAVVTDGNHQTEETLQNLQFPQSGFTKHEFEVTIELEPQAQIPEEDSSRPSGNHLLPEKEEPRNHPEEEEEQSKSAKTNMTATMYHCDQCSFTCDCKTSLKKHGRKHATIKNYKCAHCEYMCDELSRMKKHLIVHIDEKAFQCEICGYSFKRKNTLQEHIKTHTSTENSMYQCTQCEYVCKSAAGLKSHLARHLGENLYKCDLCDVACRSLYLLKKHKFAHGQKPIQCQYCSYTCVQQQQMNIHLLQHTYEFPFCCTMCNAKYKKEDSLRVHILSKHDNKHRFSCTLCSYTGNRAAGFKEHMLTHSDQKPHHCPHCTFSCKRQNQLRKHLRSHEKDRKTQNGSKTATKKMYQCLLCDFTCTRTPRLKAHLSKVHLDLPDNVIISIDVSQLEKSQVADK